MSLFQNQNENIMKKNKIGRRGWLNLSLGTAAGVFSARLFGPAPSANSESCTPTPSQTMGPFHPNKDQADKDFDLTRFNGSSQAPKGEIIYVRGKVTDENCHPIKGAVVMIWQANTQGKYSHEYDQQEGKNDPYFQGWGQAITNKQGEYGFKTIKPGAYPLAEGSADYRTPHIHFKVSRRGYHELITQMYFAKEPLNDQDILLSALSDSEKEQVVRQKMTGAEGIEPAASLVKFDLILRKVEKKKNKGIDQYVGKYAVAIDAPEMKEELRTFYGGERKDLHLTITSEKGLLFAEMPIQPRCEIFFKAADRYEYKAFEADIEFVRDDQDQVSGLVLHRHYDFPELKASKIVGD